MKQECIDTVNQAAGRQLSQTELDGIESRLKSSMLELRAKDPAAFARMTPGERSAGASTLAREQMLSDVAEAHERTIANASRVARTFADIDTVHPGLRGQVMHVKNMVISLQREVEGGVANYLRRITGLQDADGGKLFGMLQNKAKQDDIARVMFGEKASDPKAQAAGESLKNQLLEPLANAYKRAGLPLHKLDDWSVPQPHDVAKVAASEQAFVEDHMSLVDKSKYLNADGTHMSDDQLRRFLGQVWLTKATDGANKAATGEGGGHGGTVGATTNAPRQVHYKDFASWKSAMSKYGASTNLYDIINSHVHKMTKDMVLADHLGQNADATLRQALARAKVADTLAVDGKDRPAVANLANSTQRIYDAYVHPQAPGNATWANVGAQIRGVIAATQLGKLFTALPDLAGSKMAMEFNGLPQVRGFRDVLRSFKTSSGNLDTLHDLGLWFDEFHHAHARMAEEQLGSGYGKFLSDAVHRASLLNAFDRGLRGGNGLAALNMLGRVTRLHETLAAGEGESRLLRDNGVTQDHWNVWRAAELDRGLDGSHTLLTPAAIDAIPNEKLDPIIEQRVAARSDILKGEIARRDDQTAKEQAWLQARQVKFDDLRDRTNKALRELDERRQARADASDVAVAARAEVVRAHVARAEVEHDIAGYLKTETVQSRVSGFLKAVENGAAVERKVVRERVHPDNMSDAVVDRFQKAPAVGERADRAVENYGRSINAAGEELGRRRARAEARIAEAEKRAADARKTADAETQAKADALGQKFDGMTADLQAQAAELQERAAKRREYADAFQAKAGNVLDEERGSARDDAQRKLLQLAYSQMQFGARGASGPSVQDRVGFGLDKLPAGTVMGELARFALQFKSVPLGIFAAHIRSVRNSDMTVGSKASYAARFLAYSTLAGAVSQQIGNLIKGENPENMNPAGKGGGTFWADAMARGGGLGFYGDALFGQNPTGRTGAEAFMGPGIGAALDLFKEYQAARKDIEAGEPSKHSYSLAMVRWMRNNAMPLANLWYLKSAFNRLIYDKLQDYVSPGATERQERQAEQRGASFFWGPGATAPSAPDLSTAWQQ